MRFLKAMGKIILAIVLGYAGLMLASLVGGFIAGVLGVELRLSAETTSSLSRALSYVIFLGILIIIYISSKRKKRSPQEPRR
jgi:branched-subunit amino acid ABC-type transport system permease component